MHSWGFAKVPPPVRIGGSRDKGKGGRKKGSSGLIFVHLYFVISGDAQQIFDTLTGIDSGLDSLEDVTGPPKAETEGSVCCPTLVAARSWNVLLPA